MTNNTIEVHKAFTAAILANDQHWENLITDDVYFQGPLAEVQGIEDFIILNTPYFEAIKTIETHQIIVDGASLATQLTVTIEHYDNNRISFPVAEWYNIQEGKIKAFHIYFDPRPLM
ncbi:MAG: nuclear transport factor 2 family protein [Aureispira sp.]